MGGNTSLLDDDAYTIHSVRDDGCYNNFVIIRYAKKGRCTRKVGQVLACDPINTTRLPNA